MSAITYLFKAIFSNFAKLMAKITNNEPETFTVRRRTGILCGL